MPIFNILLLITLMISIQVFAKTPTPKLSQFSLYVGSSLYNSSSENTTATVPPVTQKGVLISEYQNTILYGLEYRKLNERAYIFKIGARSMNYRLIKSAKFTGENGLNLSLDITNPYSYQIHTAYFDFGYSADSLYIYTGLNYNFFNFSNPSSTTPYQTRNGIGFQTGIGYLFDPEWTIDLTLSAARVGIDSGTDYSNKTDLTFLDLQTSLRYCF